MNKLQSYCFTSFCLAPEIPGNKEFITSIISKKEIDWMRFVRIGNAHLILPALYFLLIKHDILPLLPEELTSHLKELYEINLERNQQILKQIDEINYLLNKHDIFPIYTKGTGHLLSGLYDDPGVRIIGDIDFLVEPDQTEASAKILMNNGYIFAHKKNLLRSEIRKHYPGIMKEGRRAIVEIHRWAVSNKFSHAFKSSEVQKAKKHPNNREDCYIMCDRDSMLHNFIHSQLEHRAHRNAHVYLKNLYDFHLISGRIDPSQVFKAFPFYHKQSEVYRQLVRNAFQSDRDPELSKISEHRFYHFRFKMNLRYKWFIMISYFFLHIPGKIYLSYIRKPILAIFNKELRRHLLIRMKEPGALRQHFRSYKKVFKKS